MSFVRLVSTSVASLTLASLASLAACGGDGGSTKTPDAPAAPNIGFNKPTKPLASNMEVSSGTWMEIGAADLSCLGTASTDMATTVAVTLHTQLVDFQTGSLASMGDHPVVTAFAGIDSTHPFDTQMPDVDAKLDVHIPVGTNRFGFKMTGDAILDTLLLNQHVDPGMASQTNPGKIQSISKTTASLLPGLVGVTRTPGTGVLAGAVRDCAGHEISNFIATVSSTKDAVSIITGADSYYFSASAGVPVRHGQQDSSSPDGLFMVIQLPVSATAYVQVWGYKDAADLAADKLTLISQLQAPVLADTVITGSLEIVRSGQ